MPHSPSVEVSALDVLHERPVTEQQLAGRVRTFQSLQQQTRISQKKTQHHSVKTESSMRCQFLQLTACQNASRKAFVFTCASDLALLIAAKPSTPAKAWHGHVCVHSLFTFFSTVESLWISALVISIGQSSSTNKTNSGFERHVSITWCRKPWPQSFSSQGAGTAFLFQPSLRTTRFIN